MSFASQKREVFHYEIALKYQLYNSLFITLPFENLHEIGVELPVFAETCRKMLSQGSSPLKIVEYFFDHILPIKDFDQRIDIMVLMLQFIERQIVLFDALEDAAFGKTHDCKGPGTLDNVLAKTSVHQLQKHQDSFKQDKVRIVLTAHPTQFYPPHVLGIIQDLTHAVKKNKIQKIYNLLLQLGKTPFKSREKPTPLQEAESLIYYIKKTLYSAVKKLQFQMNEAIFPRMVPQLSSLEIGFWPGGDRDGNPNVTSNTTLEVAKKLKKTIIKLYLKDLKHLQKRLTFQHIMQHIDKIIQKIINLLHNISENSYRYENFLEDLLSLRHQIIYEDQGLFVDQVDQLISAAHCFGFFCASIDIRQTSQIHQELINEVLQQENLNYSSFSLDEKITVLKKLMKENVPSTLATIIEKNSLYNDVIQSLQAIKTIQEQNGERGSNQYIISHSHHAVNIYEVFLLAYWAGWSIHQLNFDITPLFESIEDLHAAEDILEQLFQDEFYRTHLRKHRLNRQIIMLGFSDGTKDGGYVTANWEIFNCKLKLSRIAEKHHIQLVFFDGRGGPPSRGGGNTHLYYQAISHYIPQNEISLTIQGQTISSKYSTKLSARYNLEQLLTVEMIRKIEEGAPRELSTDIIQIMNQLSDESYHKYTSLKNHPVFVDYLTQQTPLLYYNEINLSSRPIVRQQKKDFSLDQLRAIPFVGAWTQMKQNIPGYYGLGTALEKMCSQGKLQQLQNLYDNFLFFKTLISNASQSLCKSNFTITKYFSTHKIYGDFWKDIHHEAQLTEEMIKKITKERNLLDYEPILQLSIRMREDIVLPLLIIQQYCLQKIHLETDENRKASLKNIIIKSIPANINAARNSV